MATGKSRVLELTTPLPCHIDACTSSASVALASEVPGGWLLVPICDSCAESLHLLYHEPEHRHDLPVLESLAS